MRVEFAKIVLYDLLIGPEQAPKLAVDKRLFKRDDFRQSHQGGFRQSCFLPLRKYDVVREAEAAQLTGHHSDDEMSA